MRENYFVAIFSFLFLGCRVRLHTRSDDGCASSCGELFMKAGWHRGIILFREALKDSKDNSNNNQQPPASGALCTPHLLQAAGMGSPLLSWAVTRWCLALHCSQHQPPHRCYADLGGSGGPRYPVSSLYPGPRALRSASQLRLRPECDGGQGSGWLLSECAGGLLPVAASTSWYSPK